jgi:hypothetical protein
MQTDLRDMEWAARRKIPSTQELVSIMMTRVPSSGDRAAAGERGGNS